METNKISGDEWTVKANVIHTHNTTQHTHTKIQFILKKKENPAICNKVIKRGKKCNKPVIESKTLHRITYETSKRVKFMEAKGEIVAFGVWGEGEMGRCWSKETKFHISRWICSGDLMHKQVVLYIEICWEVNLQCFHAQNNGNCAKCWIHSLAWLW